MSRAIVGKAKRAACHSASDAISGASTGRMGMAVEVRREKQTASTSQRALESLSKLGMIVG